MGYTDLTRGGGLRSLRDFSARGDNSTDDTGAFVAALAEGSGTVVIPPGDYVVSGNIAIPQYTRLVAAGGVRVRNSHPTNPTFKIGVVDAGGSGGGTLVNHAGVYGVHFNPLPSAGRQDTAPEVLIGYTRAAFVEGCSFGRRFGTNTGDTTTSDDESRVGTCVEIGRTNGSGTASLGANVSLSKLRGFGCYRFTKIYNHVDVYLNDVFVDTNRSDSQPVYLTGRVEACQWSNFDFVSSQTGVGTFGPSAVVLLVDDAGVRFNSFTNGYFDSHHTGLKATNGFTNTFVNCWFSCRPGYGAHVTGGGGYQFVNTKVANCGLSGVYLAGGDNHLVQGCQLFANGVSGTAGEGHLRVAGGVSVTAHHNSTSNNFSGLSVGALVAAVLESGALADVRFNRLNGLSLTDNSGGSSTLANNF